MFKRKNPSQLQAQLAALKGNSGFGDGDKNEWKLKTDAAGNGSAVIRFLPGKGDEGLPFVKLVNHGFKKNGKWFIENCSSTHGDYDSCPVCQYLSKNDSYNTNNEEYKLLKRKTAYWANILVIKDPSTPENEGKVMKIRFGVKVMEKINSMINVDEAMGDVPVDVTCLWEGANFVYKVKKVGGFTNYDDCKFQNQTELPRANDPEYQKFLSDNMANLADMVAPTQFKKFEDLETKFKQIMGTSMMAGAGAAAGAAADLNAQLSNFDQQMASFDSAQSTPSTPADVPFDMSDSTPGMDDDLDDLLNSL